MSLLRDFSFFSIVVIQSSIGSTKDEIVMDAHKLSPDDTKPNEKTIN